MATYKVIQDIEAEDKFVGPLTLKQFVFAMFGALFAYLSFFVLTKGLAWGLIATMPPSLFGFFMAVPWSSEQPTDIWVLAKIRFRLKPKKRIWDQSGMQELVTITAPKKEEKPLTKNMSQAEVKSRLKALAETIDSRGWIIKDSPDSFVAEEASDRLIDPGIMPRQVPDVDMAAIPDMLEEEHGLDSMIQQSDEARKAQLMEKMNRIRQGESVIATEEPEPVVSPPDENTENALDEAVLSASLRAKKQAGDISRGNMHAIPASQPVAQTSQPAGQDEGAEEAEQTEVEKAQASVTEQRRPDILDLARNNDLNVSTIARQASNKDKGPDEVVIALH
ncbi:MAG TPA: PrgI family protein [Candidatus Saccharimonadales bacterium]|nr:PrgI family protein [Candidatus Saccharimonadales bacterium]